MQQSQIDESINDQKPQSAKKDKKQSGLEDNIGLAAVFLTLGVVLHLFASNINIPVVARWRMLVLFCAFDTGGCT
jgi:hypothetical protein